MQLCEQRLASELSKKRNTRPIGTISDEHLEMLTRIRVRATLRAETREDIIEEAYLIIGTIENIMGHPYLPILCH